MAELIDGMLRLARVSRTPVRRETVDLSAIATRAVSQLQARDPARVVTARIEAGLTVHGDRALLDASIVNLVENAWKFTAGVTAATVEVGRTQGAEPTFFVRDNGAGFDMAYARQLFRPFHRLHGAAFEGTGIGLATVQRVISRHGGQIWAEASVGHGATFFFTVPEAP